MASIQKRYVNVKGVQTYVMEAGSGPDLLLLHGGGPGISAETTWSRNIPELAKSFHVMAVDEAGFGRTAKSKPATSVEARIDHATDLVQTLGLRRFALVGHSQGGFISFNIARRYPEQVSRLVIVSSGTTAPDGNRDERGDWSPGIKEWRKFRDDTSFECFCHIWRCVIYRPATLDDATLKRYYDDAVQTGALEIYIAASRDTSASAVAYAGYHQEYVAPYASSLTTPTLLVWGRDDDFAPYKPGLQLLEMMPTAEMHLFPEAKHMVMIDQPAAFNKLVAEFCSRQ